MRRLKAIERLMSQRLMRERFAATCVTEDEDEKKILEFSAKLVVLRWHTVTDFCVAVTLS